MSSRKNSLMYNADGYYDPTAGVALKNAEKKLPNGYVRWLGQPIYICTPRQIVSDADIQYLERCCTFAAAQGAQPIAPLLFYAEIFDLTDARDRKMILKWTRKWLRQTSEIWIFDGAAPKNLRPDIERFVRAGKTIRYFQTGDDGRFELTKTVSSRPEEPADIRPPWE